MVIICGVVSLLLVALVGYGPLLNCISCSFASNRDAFLLYFFYKLDCLNGINSNIYKIYTSLAEWPYVVVELTGIYNHL